MKGRIAQFSCHAYQATLYQTMEYEECSLRQCPSIVFMINSLDPV